jgi:hypothetical protein
VGILSTTPEFKPDNREVAAILRAPLARFFEPLPIPSARIFIPAFNSFIRAPYFDIQGHVLWGATAMMVQEYRMAMNPSLFSSAS